MLVVGKTSFSRKTSYATISVVWQPRRKSIGGNVDERREKFITQQVALQIPSRVCTKVSQTGDLSPVEAGCRKNPAGVM